MSIDEWLDSLDSSLPKKEIFRLVAEHIDNEIHSRYRIYPCNWIAMDELDGTDNSAKYTKKDRAEFEKYLEGQISKVLNDQTTKRPNDQKEFLRSTILTMYANPLRNKLAAVGSDSIV